MSLLEEDNNIVSFAEPKLNVELLIGARLYLLGYEEERQENENSLEEIVEFVAYGVVVAVVVGGVEVVVVDVFFGVVLVVVVVIGVVEEA